MAMKLMIVDDHDGMRNMIRQLIAAPGDSVLECNSGHDAVQKAGEFKPDCVTLDVNLPGLCAFTATRSIREAHPHARVIFVCSEDQPDCRQAAQDAGAVAYINKENLSELYLYVATKRLQTSARL